MWLNPEFPADLVTFTEEIFNGKLHFLCSDSTEHYFKLIKLSSGNKLEIFPQLNLLLVLDQCVAFQCARKKCRFHGPNKIKLCLVFNRSFL